MSRGAARRVLGMVRRLPSPARWALLRRLMESEASRRARLARVLNESIDRLVFVCHGNIMRSAFAAEFARRQLPAHAPQIISAGTHASAGSHAEPSARRAAATLDVSLDSHRSARLQSLQAQALDVVVCMDRANEAHAVVWAGDHAHRVFLIGDITSALPPHDREVLDPYGQGDAVTREKFDRLRPLANTWLEAIHSWREA